MGGRSAKVANARLMKAAREEINGKKPRKKFGGDRAVGGAGHQTGSRYQRAGNKSRGK